MTSVQVEVMRRDDGSYRHCCYSTENGIVRQRIGCAHLVPRDAIRHAESLDPASRPASEAVIGQRPDSPGQGETLERGCGVSGVQPYGAGRSYNPDGDGGRHDPSSPAATHRAVSMSGDTFGF